MRRTGLLAAIFAALLVCLPGSALGYSKGDLMEPAVMNNVNSMTLSQIETQLSKSPCLAHYTGRSFSWNGEEWIYGTETWSAARIIYEAAHFWTLNPEVTIAKLQEEESLVTGTSCDSWRYASAMGYDCPEKTGCSPKYAGFELQVLFGDFQIKFNEERSFGNLAYAEEGALHYSGLMLKGMFARCESCALETFSGIAMVDGQEIYLETAPTAALLSYTPHVAPVLEEMSIFESYGFGSTVAGQVGLVEPEPKEPPKEKEPVVEVKTPPAEPAPVNATPGVSTVSTPPPATLLAPIVSPAKPKPKPAAKCHRIKVKHHYRCKPKPKKKKASSKR